MWEKIVFIFYLSQHLYDAGFFNKKIFANSFYSVKLAFASAAMGLADISLRYEKE